MALITTQIEGHQAAGAVRFHHRDRLCSSHARGIGADVVREISALKGEPQWMLDFRLKALDTFLEMPMPDLGRRSGPARFRGVLLLYARRPRRGASGTTCRTPSRTRSTAGHPGGGAQVSSPASRPRWTPSPSTAPEGGVGAPGHHLRRYGYRVQEYGDLVRKYISTAVPSETTSSQR